MPNGIKLRKILFIALHLFGYCDETRKTTLATGRASTVCCTAYGDFCSARGERQACQRRHCVDSDGIRQSRYPGIDKCDDDAPDAVEGRG